MSRIMLAGYYGSGNAGDEAMLTAIIEDLRGRLDAPRFTAVSVDPDATVARHGIEAVGRFDLGGLIRRLRRTDLFISGGGSLIQDVTSDRNLTYQLGLLWLARRYARRVMLYGQGIGPVRSRFGWAMARMILNRLDVITVRDAQSAELLDQSGIRRPVIKLAADPALLYPHQPSADRGREILRRYGFDGSRPVVGLFPRAWPTPDLEQNLARVADLVHRGPKADVALVPMQLPDDIVACRRTAQLMRRPAPILDGLVDIPDLLDVAAAMPLVIGMRLHSLVFAARAGSVPVGLSYDPKVDSFLRELGLEPAASVSGFRLDDAMLAIERAWTERERLAAEVARLTAELTRRAELSGELAAGLARGAGLR